VLRHRVAPCAALLALVSCGGSPEASPERRAEVAARGAQVMPFDLERTRHVFESLPDGGRQSVTALAAADTGQIRLIREHLREEAARFARGDFRDPAAIHGHAMPGLAELAAGAADIRVEFRELPEGGELRYLTAKPALRDALHRWFAAQRMDHGAGTRD
jgi:hypothetical protein